MIRKATAALCLAVAAVSALAVPPIITPTPQTNDYAYNFTRANTAKIMRAIERANFPVSASYPAYNNPINIDIGDSTTGGAGNGIYNTSDPTISYARGAYPVKIAKLLTQRTGVDVVWQSYWGEAKANGYDNRVTLGTGWSNNSGQISIAGYALNSGASSTTTTSIDFTSAGSQTFDTIDIWYIQYSGGGTFTVNVDGGSTLATINSGSPATSALIKATITGASLGTHVVNIARTTGGSVYIVGVVPRNGTIRQIVNINGGRGGWKASDYASTTNAWSPANAIAALAPDSCRINLQINDERSGNATDITAWKASLQTIIDKCKLSGDPILIVPHWISTNSADAGNYQTAAIQLTYTAAAYQLADLNGIPLIDFQKLYVSRQNEIDLGYTYDQLHMAWPDAAKKAQAIMDSIFAPWRGTSAQ